MPLQIEGFGTPPPVRRPAPSGEQTSFTTRRAIHRAPAPAPAPPRPAPAPVPAPAPAPAPAPSIPDPVAEAQKEEAAAAAEKAAAEEAQREAEAQAAAEEAARRAQRAAMIEQIQATPLDPELLAAFSARQRAAQRGTQEAEIAGQLGRERSQVDFNQFLRRLGVERDQAIGGLRGEAAARNLAFQPMFVGTGMRDIRDEVARSQAQAAQQRAAFLAGIERQIAQAQQSRDSELAAVARDTARAQADHQQWIQTQIAALGPGAGISPAIGILDPTFRGEPSTTRTFQ